MKRFLSLFAAGVLALTCSAVCAEAVGVVYEAEQAQLTGTLTLKTDLKASGWKAVGTFENSDDAITFMVDIPADGVYDFTITAMGIGGSKMNNFLVDGNQLATFGNDALLYNDAVVKGILLKAGQHAVTITPSWGWIYLDKLTVTPAQAIDETVYNVEPVLINPKATENAQKLFAFLCESYGKVTLSGQVCDGGLNGAEFQAIHEVTGKYPAILGLDMMDYSPSRRALGAAQPTAVERAIEFHEAGGIVTFCWHWTADKQYILDGTDANGNPRWWGAFYSENVTFDLEAVMNGTDAHGKAALDKDIAEIARQLLSLQEAGVPVLWRPLHEASGGWFWWGAKGAVPYKQLWVYLYDQLTNVYGCNNLIWVWNGQHADWYPGDEYVDIIGEDIYADKHVYASQHAKFTELMEYASANKIIALTENGVVFDIDQAVENGTRWAWFSTWSGDFVQQNGNYSEEYTEAHILRKAYDSEYVITLDELPDLY